MDSERSPLRHIVGPKAPRNVLLVSLLGTVLGVTGAAVLIAGNWLTTDQLRSFVQYTQVPTGLLGLLLTWLVVVAASRQRKREQRAAASGRSDIADRIEVLRANLAQSATLIDEINAELKLQTTALDRIKGEAEQNQRLAALHKEEADAVRNLVAATIEGAQEKAARPSRRQQWLFFLAGLFFSVPLGVIGNFIYSLLAR